MRIVQLNLAVDPALQTPGLVLDRYHTLTEWSQAIAEAGADVHVVQRFALDAAVKRGDVTYEFVRDGHAGMPAPWEVFPRAIAAVLRASPDVVHINGLMFPGMARALRTALPHASALVLQDHSGAIPAQLPWPLNRLTTAKWRRALGMVDAVSFTAAELAVRWHAVGLPADAAVLEIPEASTTFVPLDDPEAQASTRMTGSPVLLWVGRVNANKDPLTVLDAVDRAAAELPHARLWMIVPEGERRHAVDARIAASHTLRTRVTVIGAVARQDMPAFYSAADIFVSGSRHEGSGYALIESMACGTLPCVTDIPAFRALTASCGERWPVGDSAACAAALVRAAHQLTPEVRTRVRQAFETRLSWPVIARRTLEAYGNLVRRRTA